MDTRNKKALITGAAGFIGSHVTAALLQRGWKVTGLDDLSSGNLSNLSEVRRHPGFRFVRGDVCDLATVRKVGRGADCILHLAANKIPRYGKALDTLLVNTRGTLNVLDAASTQGSKVILASTSDVYGKNLQLPFREDSDCVLGPSSVMRWSYAASKIFDEHLCFGFQEKNRVPFVILRFFGGYGPHQHLGWRGGPQAVFIQKALKGEKLEIHGDGKQTRSFVYVADLVDGIVRSIESPRAVGQIFNLGDEREITILELAQMIWRTINPDKACALKWIPYKRFGNNYEDVRRRRPDLTKARKILGYEPKVTLEEGLAETIQWQRQRMGNGHG